MALLGVLPARLLAAGMAVGDHWQMYLPAGALGFMLMLRPMRAAERGNRMKPVFLGGVLLLALSQLGLAFVPDQVWPLAGLLLLFFTGFNLMEAMLPSLVSRWALARSARRWPSAASLRAEKAAAQEASGG